MQKSRFIADQLSTKRFSALAAEADALQELADESDTALLLLLPRLCIALVEEELSNDTVAAAMASRLQALYSRPLLRAAYYATASLLRAAQNGRIVATEPAPAVSTWNNAYNEPLRTLGAAIRSVASQAWMDVLDVSGYETKAINLIAWTVAVFASSKAGQMQAFQALWQATAGLESLKAAYSATFLVTLGPAKTESLVQAVHVGGGDASVSWGHIVEAAVHIHGCLEVGWAVCKHWLRAGSAAAVTHALQHPITGHEAETCGILKQKPALTTFSKVTRQRNQRLNANAWPLLAACKDRSLTLRLKFSASCFGGQAGDDGLDDALRSLVDEALGLDSPDGSLLAVVGLAMLPSLAAGDDQLLIAATAKPAAALLAVWLTITAQERDPKQFREVGVALLELAGTTSREELAVGWTPPEVLFRDGGRSLFAGVLPATEVLEFLTSVELSEIDVSLPMVEHILRMAVKSTLENHQVCAGDYDRPPALLFEWLDRQALQRGDLRLIKAAAGAWDALNERLRGRLPLPACEVRSRIEKAVATGAHRGTVYVAAALASSVFNALLDQATGPDEKGNMYEELCRAPLKLLLRESAQLMDDPATREPVARLERQLRAVFPQYFLAEEPRLHGFPVDIRDLDTRPEVNHVKILSALWPSENEAAAVKPGLELKYLLSAPTSDAEVTTSGYLVAILFSVRSAVFTTEPHLAAFLAAVDYFATAAAGWQASVVGSGPANRITRSQCVGIIQNLVGCVPLRGVAAPVASRLRSTVQCLAQLGGAEGVLADCFELLPDLRVYTTCLAVPALVPAAFRVLYNPGTPPSRQLLCVGVIALAVEHCPSCVPGEQRSLLLAFLADWTRAAVADDGVSEALCGDLARLLRQVPFVLASLASGEELPDGILDGIAVQPSNSVRRELQAAWEKALALLLTCSRGSLV
ncbi:hypothetical protein DIPPA_30076 [Diplonema papillatum]|nr:hypothetical protein DIPPA_30076 [Diplonema papillatum]